MKTFEFNTTASGYKNLKRGDLVVVKEIKNGNVIFTLNKEENNSYFQRI